MEKVSTEILIIIFENVPSFQDLVRCRAVSRRFRDVLDRVGAQISRNLGRQQLHGFDDALLAIRLQRIPKDLLCTFDPDSKTYIHTPSKDFLHAVQHGQPTPPGTPIVSQKPWFDECASVMDLYLIALACTSTMELNMQDLDNQVNLGKGIFPPGFELNPGESRAKARWLKIYLQGFYRFHIFSTLYSPGAFENPIAEAIRLLENKSRWTGIRDVVAEALWQHPIFHPHDRKNNKALILFQGFFDWLCDQPGPYTLKYGPLPDAYDKRSTLYSDKERQEIAMTQLLRVLGQLWDRLDHCEKLSKDPEDRILYPQVCFHADFMPCDLIRPKLPISVWSPAQVIINTWADSNEISSVVVHPRYELYNELYVETFSTRMPAKRIIEDELYARYNIEYPGFPEFRLEEENDFCYDLHRG